MIRRISKNQDLLDIIKGYPEGVLNNIHTLKYYTYGNEDYAVYVDFQLKGDVIEAVLPAAEMQTLLNGILYRKAYYSAVDERFPDHKYDLEIEDNMNIWLGDEHTTHTGGEVTPEWVEAKLEPYATRQWVEEYVGRKPYRSIRKIDDYLYEIDYDNLDYDYARSHWPAPNAGGCSVLAFGSSVLRNYDWYYDYSASFVITSHPEGKNEVYGVGGSLAELTGDFVDSGADSDAYKLLPFCLNDGFNDKGLFCEVNVVPSWHNNATAPSIETRESISSIMMVRYILDNFSTVAEAYDYITKYVEVFNAPYLEESGYELHWLLKDADETKVFEIVDDSIVELDYDRMTNFHLYGVELNEDGSVNTPESAAEGAYARENGIEDFGMGLERWNQMNRQTISTEEQALQLMRHIFYTNAYTERWASEFVGGDITVNTPYDDEAVVERIDAAVEKYENRSRESADTWHTVHGCIYDIDSKVIKIISQEGETVYEFDYDSEIAPVPETDGTYILKAVRNGDKVTYTWVLEA